MVDSFASDQVSFFKENKITDLYSEIQETYLANDFPWIIGYSGGKDSTATVQIVWNAIEKLSIDKRIKPIYIISSDTFVETPVVVNQINKTLQQIQKAADSKNLPIYVEKVFPEISDSFWVNLIGRGYPAPSQRFRWCTERLKIEPANRFILETAEKFGEVVMVLGARKAESLSRAQVMRKRRRVSGSKLFSHSKLSRAYVYTPIEDFSADDVWTYLDVYDSPWEGDNRELVSMYKRSNPSGECPLVIDTSTPSCGNSRFGCWVCTVVEQDRSMQALIMHGEEWMEPLLEFREKLAVTQIPEEKHNYRNFKRRNGQMIVRQDGRMIPGPYKFSFRKSLLKELLTIQKKLQDEGPNPEILLISDAEIHEIRQIWRIEESDWEDSVPNIYRHVYGKELCWIEDERGSFSSSEKSILKSICDRYGVPLQLLTRLIDLELRMSGMSRRTGIFEEIHQIFAEEWSTAEEVQARVMKDRTKQIELGLE